MNKFKVFLIYTAIVFGTSIIYVGLISLTYNKFPLKFGVVTSTGTFPTALTNAQDNDIINAGDFNHLEYAIGEIGTTSPATLRYLIVNAASTTYATHTSLWTTNGTITNASTTYLTVSSGLFLSTALSVASGGTGAATFTSNGVLYGNGTGALQVTAQGGTNSVLTANAGAPSFSDSPTILKLTATNGTFTNATSSSSFFLPYGTLSLSQGGQVQINSSTENFSWRSNNATQVVSATSSIGWVVASTTASDGNISGKPFDQASTITKIMCNITGGTSFNFNIGYDADITATGAKLVFSSAQTVSTTTSYYIPSFANNTPSSGQVPWINITAVSGTIRFASCSLFYKITP